MTAGSVSSSVSKMKMVSTLPEDVNMNENAILATREIRAGILSCNFNIEIKTGLSVKLVKVYIDQLPNSKLLTLILVEVDYSNSMFPSFKSYLYA